MNQQVEQMVRVLLLSVFLSSNIALADPDTPSGTIVIDETQVMWIVGGDIGGGTLHFQGEEHKFKTDGVKLGGFGIHKVKLTGDVYGLNSMDDFAGIYAVAEAGATLGKMSKGDFVMRNKKDVTLHLKSGAQGVALAIGVEGLKITLE